MAELHTPTQEDRARERERERLWADHDKARDLDANERQFERAIAEIPNPGPIEPLTELQAFHAEQTDPPPGPYPDPPQGPYPDPVIKERPSEEAVYGRTRHRTSQATSTDRARGRAGQAAGEPLAAERGGTGRSEADRSAHQAGQR